MVIIRFPDKDTELQALGWLAGRFSGKTWANGDTMVPEAALGPLAANGFRFSVERRPTYQDYAPLRDVAAAAV
jgi:hypothetical protein